MTTPRAKAENVALPKCEECGTDFCAYPDRHWCAFKELARLRTLSRPAAPPVLRKCGACGDLKQDKDAAPPAVPPQGGLDECLNCRHPRNEHATACRHRVKPGGDKFCECPGFLEEPTPPAASQVEALREEVAQAMARQSCGLPAATLYRMADAAIAALRGRP